MKTMKALLILLAFAGFATPVFGESDSKCLNVVVEGGYINLYNECNRDVHFHYCIVNPHTTSKRLSGAGALAGLYDCEKDGGGFGRVSAGGKHVALQSDALGEDSIFRWFACAMPRLPRDWDKIANRGICSAAGDSTAANQKTGTPGATREDRRWLQTALKSEGFDPGPADGQFGPKTQTAIKAWQRSIGQAATGQLTDSQMRRLLPQRWKDAQQTKPTQQAKASTGNNWKAPSWKPSPAEAEKEVETEAAAVAALSPKCVDLPTRQMREIGDVAWCWHNLDEQQDCYTLVNRWRIDRNRSGNDHWRWIWTGDCRGGKLARGTLTVTQPDRTPIFEGPIVDGLRNGHWVHWYSAGMKDEEGSYVDGVKDGRWTDYMFQSGEVGRHVCYRAGKEIDCN